MAKIVMYNPKNSVKIETILDFKEKWEKLGFIELSGVLLFSMSG